MTQLKGKIKDFKEVCRIVSLKGKDIKGKEFLPIPEFVINAGSNPNTNLIEISAMDRGAHLAVNLKYDMEVLSAGSMVIGDVEKFQKYLDRFGNSDDVVVENTENRIIITRNKIGKVAKFPMASEQTVDSSGAISFLQKFKKVDDIYASPSTRFDVSLSVKAEDVKSVVDDGEAVNQRVYPCNITTDIMNMSVGEESTGLISTIIPIENLSIKSGSDINIKSSYAYGIDNLFNNLTGRVKIFFANNIGACPMILEQKTEKYDLKAIIAPVILD